MFKVATRSPYGCHQRKEWPVAELTECPNCGGPLVGSGADLRCVECGFTRDEFDDIDDVEDIYNSDNEDDIEDHDDEDID